MTNYLQMTEKDLQINTVMDKLMQKEIITTQASNMINKSLRQTFRLKQRYKEEWSAWILHKLRWKPSNNKRNNSRYFSALEIIKEKYPDYGPTLCSEKLREKHNISIPVSTLRLAMIQHKVWYPKSRRKVPKTYTARPRKEAYWEMIQYDGSYHLWFEGRNNTQYQCLLVAVDDATNEVTAKFDKNEWLFATFRFWEEYLQEKWKPQSIYLDKFATYKVNYPNATDDSQLPTQFNRACQNLGVKLIFAHSPQAKGRVERMNGTLQDRLVKALREENISDIDTANKFLKETFLPDFNKKFMVDPKSTSNLHIHLRNNEYEKLPQHFSKHFSRVVANDFTIRFNNQYIQLYRKKDCGYTIRPSQSVTVEEHMNGDIKVSYHSIYIEHEISFERPQRKNKLLTAPVKESPLNTHRESGKSEDSYILERIQSTFQEKKYQHVPRKRIVDTSC